MAWNHEQNLVLVAGCADCAAAVRSADRGCDLFVCTGFSVRYIAKRLPDKLLEFTSLKLQRNGKFLSVALEIFAYLCDCRLSYGIGTIFHKSVCKIDTCYGIVVGIDYYLSEVCHNSLDIYSILLFFFL